MQELAARRDVLGRESPDGGRQLALHRLELLIGHEPQAHLRRGFGGDHGLRTVRGEAPHDAVDFQGGERPQALQDGVPLEPREGAGLHAVLQELAVLERQALPGRELRLGRAAHRAVQTGNLDLPVGGLEPREQSHQLFVRVGRGAAEFTGVEIRLGGAHRDFGVTQAAQRRVDGGPLRGDVGHIGDEHDVRARALRLAPQQLEQHAAAVLLFALDQETEVDRRSSRRLDRLEEAEHLPFVVRRPPGEQLGVAHRGLEGRRGPLVERVGRLDVVMAVQQQRRCPGYVRSDAPHDRMSAAREELYLAAAQPPQFAGDPLRRGATIGVVRREGRDRRDAEEIRQLAEQAIRVHRAGNLGAPGAASQRPGRAYIRPGHAHHRVVRAVPGRAKRASDGPRTLPRPGGTDRRRGEGLPRSPGRPSRSQAVLGRVLRVAAAPRAPRGRALGGAGRAGAAGVAWGGAAGAGEHAERGGGGGGEILVPRRYAFYAPRRPEDLAPAERWFAETGSVVLAAAAGGDVPDDATLVHAFLDLASDSGWRFGQVVTVGPALPAWQALAEELRLPLSGRAAFDPEAVPLVVAQRPLPGDAGWSALPSAVARGGAGLVFVLEQAAEDAAVTRADVIGELSGAGRRRARGINVAHALSEAQHPAARWAGRRLKP